MLQPIAHLLEVQKELQFINYRQFMVFCNSSVTSFSVFHYLDFLFLGINSMSWENPHGATSVSINQEIWGVLPNYQLNVSDLIQNFSLKFCHSGNGWCRLSNVSPEDQFIQFEFCKRFSSFFTIHFLLCFAIKATSMTSCFSSSSPSSKASSVFLRSVSLLLPSLCFQALNFFPLQLFYISTKMNFFSIFTITNFLFLSLAINFSLIMRVYFNNEIHGQPKVVDMDGPASQRTLLSVSSSGEEDIDKVISLNHGDPTMYEKYWMMAASKTTVVIPGWQSMSYFSDVQNLCWFLEPELAKQILRLHSAVVNAVTEGRHIVIGTGSSQLIMAALFALSPADGSKPMSVVSAAPFYSSYPVMSTFLKSGLFNWVGDARSFNKEGSYIEFITSPNNPDGFVRTSTVNQTGGMLVHDLAYYWPQYTPISSPADHDLSLFTVTKATGHAGTRVGWALVKDEEVAKKMVKFIELNTIGVSRDAQLRAAKILEVMTNTTVGSSGGSFFHISYHHMEERWRQLRAAVENNRRFSLPEFAPGFCHFFQKETQPQPAFAWLKCEDDAVEDCESFLKGHKILTRGGSKFGVSPKFVRISMVDRDVNFSLFLKRLSKLR